MGAYLSQPKTDKVSTDEANDLLMVGASSMQGWRNSQEDAHNSILNYDKNTSFFAVYDGHGGAEVATYCADKLPQFLKDLESYKIGDLDKALQAAFLGFDRTLLEPEVVEILKILAGEKNFAEADDSDVLDDDEDDEDLAELREEGSLPLNEVLEKYKGGGPSMPALKKVKDGEPRASGSKPQSPFLRGRRAAAVAADAATKAEINEEKIKPSGSAASSSAENTLIITKDTADNKMETDELEDDSTVSSSSSGARKSTNNSATSAGIEAAEAEATESHTLATNGSAKAANSSTKPDSSLLKESEQNGSVTSSVNKAIKAADVSTSTSSSSSASAGVKVVAAEDGIVSGSNESAAKLNGNGTAEATSSTVKIPASADRSGISSTSKDAKKAKKTNPDDDSTDDDADFDVEESSSNEESDARHALEYSSEDDLDDDDDDDDDEDEDDEDDEEEEADEEEDEEGALANEQFCANMIEEPGKDSGCTAVVAVLNGRDLYVANAGDSRCVVCRNGKAIEMSLDHKPEDDEESARILKAGGRVTLDGRVNGGLNLSRAIGDHAYKMNLELTAEEQMISALPDIKKLIITPEDEFMVLACDGIWNFMSSEEVVDFVRLRLKEESKKVSQICEELFENCLAPNTMGDGTGCDNMTAVIVRFQPKLLDLPTKINPDETEDVLLAKQAAEADAADASLQKSLKRSASPTSDDNSNEAENANKTKRMKTDDKEESNTSSSSNDATSSSSTSTTTAAAKTASANSAEAEQKECDSVNTANNEAAAST